MRAGAMISERENAPVRLGGPDEGRSRAMPRLTGSREWKSRVRPVRLR